MILNYIMNIIYNVLWIYQAIIVISLILSWIPSLMQYKIPRLIRQVSDWYMEPFHGILVIGFLDFTPIIGISILEGVMWFCFYLS